MTHFAVLVRVLPGEDLDTIMAPYQENNMGDCPSEFMEFTDVTDEIDSGWKENTTTMASFIDPDGKIHEKRDNRFKVAGTGGMFGTTYGGENPTRWQCPEGWTERDVPIREYYGSKEAYAEKCHGYRFDEKQKAFGYWENPNCKWDWYVSDNRSRWGGYLEGRNERTAAWFKRNRDDHKQAAIAKCREFVGRYNEALGSGGEKFWGSRYDDAPTARHKALDMGLAKCQNAGDFDQTEGIVTIKWERQTTKGIDRFDVCKPIPNIDAFIDRQWSEFFPYTTWAFLDGENGWIEPGRMGMFASHHESPDERVNYRSGLLNWLYSMRDDATVVCVDCHI